MALALVAGHAEAADARYRLAIAPKSFADALIDLGVQTNTSIVGVSACGGGGRASLAGVYSLEDALRRLLADAPCAYRLVDARTVRIAAAAPARPAPEPVRPPVFVAELVVTATKRPASLDRLPAGVSAISHDQITVTGAADPGQTTGQLAGVLTTNLGPGRDKLIIRGLSDGAFTGRARSTVSTYLDETPLNYNAPDPDLRLVDVERIEVIRGPQGALYGSGAISGIYRIVTRKPDLGDFTAGVAGLTSWTDGGDPSREIEGYLSVPIIPDRVAVRLVAYHDLQGGYLDDVNLRLANVDKTVRNGGRIALRLQVSDAWRVDALASAQRLRSDDTQYTTLSQQNQRRANRVREAHENDFAHLGVTVRGELGWASLSSSLAYVRHTYSSRYDADGVLETLGASRAALGVYDEGARAGMLVQDLVLNSTGAGPFSWLVGAYASNTLEHTPSVLGIRAVTGDIATAYRENRKDRLRELAVYGEASWRVAPGWIASLGGRLFQSDVRTSSDIAAISPGVSRAFENEKQFTGLSPKISVQREFETGDLIYGLITEGYRPGGFNSSGFLPIRANRTTFTPDRLRNYEVGAKLRLLDRRMAVRAAAYYDDWTNIQTDQYRPSGLAYTANVGDARILGIEAEVGYDWDFGLSVLANGLLSDSRIRRPNQDFARGGVTNTLPGVPSLSGGLLAVYQRPLAGLTLRLSGQASYIGRSALSFDAGLQERMGHYLRAKLSAEVAAGAWSAGVFVSNPTNDTGDTFAYGNPFSFGKIRQVTPQRPRTAGLRLAAAF